MDATSRRLRSAFRQRLLSGIEDVVSDTTFGPQFVRERGLRHPPSRSLIVCPLCDKPVDVTSRHAIVVERYEGEHVAGRYAHEPCCIAQSQFVDLS